MNMIIRALNTFRSQTRDDIPISTLEAFLWIAGKDKPAVQDMMKALVYSKQGASRVVSVLGPGLPDKDGFGLIQLRDDPKDRRYKLITLTPRGKQLYDQLMNIIRGN
jgi:DNA-binding MarR family transcriptional regulator